MFQAGRLRLNISTPPVEMKAPAARKKSCSNVALASVEPIYGCLPDAVVPFGDPGPNFSA